LFIKKTKTLVKNYNNSQFII